VSRAFWRSHSDCTVASFAELIVIHTGCPTGTDLSFSPNPGSTTTRTGNVLAVGPLMRRFSQERRRDPSAPVWFL
jgi:hypothetical protein